MHDVEQERAGERAVAGHRGVGEDDVARLLAAEREVAPLELVEHVPVADGHLDELDVVAVEATPQPEVRHHGRDDGVAAQLVALLQVERAHRHDLVAVDEAAALVDRDDAVAVAVERESGVGTRRDDRLLELGRVGRAALVG